MANQSLTNPFADYGTIIYGQRFIGRKDAINKIKQRVLGANYGNLAIMGLPRIGKSSLAWHAIMNEKENLLASKTIPVFLYTGKCDDSKDFFLKMATYAHDELEYICEQDSRYAKFSERFLTQLKDQFDKDIIQKYFKLVKRLGYKLIYILDEFDSAQDIFNKSDFQLLRELAYNPETRLCLVTTSRKTIEDIEIRDGAISNFAGIFSDLRLSMFSADDIEEYWQYFSDQWSPDEKYKRLVYFYTGGHPMLMDQINSKMFGFNLDKVFEMAPSMSLEMMQTLDGMVNTLEKEGLLNSAIQLVDGPLYDVDQKHIEKLLRYGFIKQEKIDYKRDIFGGLDIGPVWNDYAYCCFSEYCTMDFYRRYYADVPYATIWSKTENQLRQLIKKHIKTNCLSEDWLTEMRNSIIDNPPFKAFKIEKWDTNVSTLKNNRDKMVDAFPVMTEGDLVDFTLTAQIFDIFIRPFKQWYNTHVFTGPWETWNSKFEFLTKLRNPIAHNNAIENLKEEMRIATDYCKEISIAIEAWMKQNIS